MTRRMFQVIFFELRRNLLRKGYLFATFGIPAIALVLLLGYQFIIAGNNDDTSVPEFDFRGISVAGYVDQSGLFAELPEALSSYFIPYNDVDAGKADLENGEIDALFVIAPDFLETGNVTEYVPTFDFSRMAPGVVEQLFYATLAEDLPPDVAFRLRQPSVQEEVNIQRGEAQNEDADFIAIYAFTIVFITSVFMTNAYLMQTVIEEKENRLIEILISTMRPVELLMGKIFALSIVGIVQVVVWVASMFFLLQVALRLPAFALTILSSIAFPVEMLPMMIVYFVLGYLLFAAIFGMIGAISSSMQEGPQYVTIFVLPSILPFYFFELFINQPNHIMVQIFSYFPLTSPLSMIMRLTLGAVGPLEIILSIALLAVGALGMMWLAGRFFRVQTLLSGNPFKLRDLPRLLRD